MGKYSSVDIKWSLHEDFRSLLRILSPLPDQRLNDGLKEKLHNSLPLFPFNWSLTTVSKGNRRVVRRMPKLCPQGIPSPGPGALLNSNSDVKGKVNLETESAVSSYSTMVFSLLLLESSKKLYVMQLNITYLVI